MDPQMPNTVVVLPAGGTGQRMGTGLPKQFMEIDSKKIYIWTIEKFFNLSWVKEIYLVISHEYMSIVEKELEERHLLAKVCLVVGSETRHRSIQAGVFRAQERRDFTKAEVVIIHDAVRPCISQELIVEVIRNADTHGACGPVRPLVSTILTVRDDGFLDEALPRSKLRASEMPQAFRLDVINNAYEKCSEDDLNFGTECLLLAQTYSKCRVRLLDWHQDLFKVTFDRDLVGAAAILTDGPVLQYDLRNIRVNKS